jgi:hypothetical protein
MQLPNISGGWRSNSISQSKTYDQSILQSNDFQTVHYAYSYAYYASDNN